MGGGTISTKETKIEALKLQSSTYGATIPVVFGLTRIAGNMLWYGGFKAIKHTKTETAGKGGGTKVKNVTYTYTANVAMGLCEGQVLGIPRTWRGKDQYTGGIASSQILTTTETYAVPGGGGSKTLTNASGWRATVQVSYTGTIDVGDGTTSGPIYLAEGIDYTVAAGVYTFGAAWAGVTVSIEYQYLTGTLTQAGLVSLGLTMFAGAVGQTTWSVLTSGFSAEAVPYSGIAYVAGADYDLGGDATVQNHNFEVQGRLAYHLGTSVPDADPAMFLLAMLTDGRFGALFPASRLNFYLWSKYCRAAGLLMSPAFTEQIMAGELVDQLAKLTNTAPVWSAGALKMIPYGDTSQTGNGSTYTPYVTPAYDLNDAHFLPRSGGGEPIAVTPKPSADAKNYIRIEFLDRDNDFNVAIADAKDQADIDVNGLRTADIISAHWITSRAIATKIAQITLQRSLYVRNEYEFKLPWTFDLLEPMDLVTLTDSYLGLSLLPVRITQLDDSEDGERDVRAEEFPSGVATASTYGSQAGVGFDQDYNAAPGSVSAPYIFMAPGDRTPTGIEVYAAVTGTGANWGGCTVWVSLDGTNYSQRGVLYGGSRYGSLTGAISGGNLPVQLLDTTDTLTAASATDAAALSSLCYIGGTTKEYLAHQGATLTGAGAYTLSGLVRGAYGTSGVAAHATSDPFVRVDEGVGKSGPLELSMLGQTIYFKFTSFNVFGGAEQDLATVTQYSYVVTGEHSGISAPSGLTATAVQGGILFTIATATGTLNASNIFEVYEHTASTPYSAATLVWSGIGNVFVLPKTDTTTRYYWVRTRRGSVTSSPYPAVTGVSGAAGLQAPPDADASVKNRIITDAEFLLDFGASTQGWSPNSLAAYTSSGGLIGGYARLSPNGSSDAYVTSYKYGKSTDYLIGAWPININVRWRVNSALTGANKRLGVQLIASYDDGGTPYLFVLGTAYISMAAAVVGTWYQSNTQLIWSRTGAEHVYGGAAKPPVPRIRFVIGAADVSAGTVDIDYANAEIGNSAIAELSGIVSGGATATAGLSVTAGFTPVTHTYTSGTAATETVPTGASQVVISVSGGGGGGANAWWNAVDSVWEIGGLGGNGGKAVTTVSVSGGQTLTYTVGAAGVAATSAGGASTCSSGTKTITTMTGNGGAKGLHADGAAGTATGGTTSNTTGGGRLGGVGGVNGGAAATNGESGQITFYYT